MRIPGRMNYIFQAEYFIKSPTLGKMTCPKGKSFCLTVSEDLLLSTTGEQLSSGPASRKDIPRHLWKTFLDGGQNPRYPSLQYSLCQKQPFKSKV
jgi:hypothetical protein